MKIFKNILKDIEQTILIKLDKFIKNQTIIYIPIQTTSIRYYSTETKEMVQRDLHRIKDDKILAETNELNDVFENKTVIFYLPIQSINNSCSANCTN